MTESEMKVWLKNNWDGWMETYEPRIGSGIGIPDVQVVVDRAIIPIELKLAKIEDGILRPSEIRPAQINWHRNIFSHGVPSLFLFGYGTRNVPNRLFVKPGNYIQHWAGGFEIENLGEISVNKKKFSPALKQYIRWMLQRNELKFK